MRTILPRYLDSGLPATASVTFLKVPTPGKKIVVNGTEFIYGTDFLCRGFNTADVAQAFCRAVNGEPEEFGSTHFKSNPFWGIAAMYFGNKVFLWALSPGTAGNAYTLSTDESSTITVSGATFSGGSAGTSGTGSSATTATQVSAAKTAGQSVVIPAGAKEWTVSIWTGTATVNGAAGCPAGFSDGSEKANAATITIAFDTPGTGYVRYAT